MQRREDQPDYQSAALIFLGVSLLWLFLIVWGLFGMGPVLVLAVMLNHLITRLGIVLQDYSVTEDQF